MTAAEAAGTGITPGHRLSPQFSLMTTTPLRPTLQPSTAAAKDCNGHLLVSFTSAFFFDFFSPSINLTFTLLIVVVQLRPCPLIKGEPLESTKSLGLKTTHRQVRPEVTGGVVTFVAAKGNRLWQRLLNPHFAKISLRQTPTHTHTHTHTKKKSFVGHYAARRWSGWCGGRVTEGDVFVGYCEQRVACCGVSECRC